MPAAIFTEVENNFIVYSLRLDYNFVKFREHQEKKNLSVKEMCNESTFCMHKTSFDALKFIFCAGNEQVILRT